MLLYSGKKEASKPKPSKPTYDHYIPMAKTYPIVNLDLAIHQIKN